MKYEGWVKKTRKKQQQQQFTKERKKNLFNETSSWWWKTSTLNQHIAREDNDIIKFVYQTFWDLKPLSLWLAAHYGTNGKDIQKIFNREIWQIIIVIMENGKCACEGCDRHHRSDATKFRFDFFVCLVNSSSAFEGLHRIGVENTLFSRC